MVMFDVRHPLSGPPQARTQEAGQASVSCEGNKMKKAAAGRQDKTAAESPVRTPDYMDPANDAFNLFASPMYLMAHVDFQFHEDVDKVIGKLGLSRTQYRLMTVLAQTSPLNIGELSACALLKRSTSSHALVAMRRNDWVTTTVNPKDNRIIEVALTDAGQELIARARQSAALQTQRAMRGLSSADLDHLTRTLQTIVANLSKLPIE